MTEQARLGEFGADQDPRAGKCQAVAAYTGDPCQRDAVAFGYCADHLSHATAVADGGTDAERPGD